MDLLKLNLGPGEHYADGWVNIDIYDGNRVDLVADMHDLPFSDSSVSHVYCGHVLEHLHLEDVTSCLHEVSRVLRDDGWLLVVGPDVARGRQWLTEGRMTKEMFEQLLEGEGRWPGDDHLWRCTETKVVELLEEVFDHVEPIPILAPQGWPIVSRIGWQCCVLASGGSK